MTDMEEVYIKIRCMPLSSSMGIMFYFMNTFILCLALLHAPAAAPAKEAPQAAAPQRAPEAGTQRNQNIQINLIDNNALNERLGREGIQPAPPRDFTAVRSDYASEFGGMGRNIDIAAPDKRN